LTIKLDDDIIIKMLDDLCSVTDLSFSLFLAGHNQNKPLYSKDNWPEYCKKIWDELDEEICCGLFPADEKLHMCKAGLWCKTISIKLDEHNVGYFNVGHRQIEGMENDSILRMDETLRAYEQYSFIHRAEYKSLLEEVPKVTEDHFNNLDKILLENILIAEHERANREEQKLIALKGLAVNIAHQFLLPIQSIVANSENLLNEIDEIETNSNIITMASDILDEICILAFTAETLRDWMNEGIDNTKLEFKKQSIIPIINYAKKIFKSGAEKRNIIINDVKILNQDDMIIRISRPHIETVIFNLINNAVKYSYAGSERKKRYIDIICKEIIGFYCIEITNYGIGILPEELDGYLIFENGYRGKLTRDRSRIGSGLGLGTVKRIVEAHRGDITIESEAVLPEFGKVPYKTTVRVYLPKD